MGIFAIYKNGQIIAIISNININGCYVLIYNHDPCLHIVDTAPIRLETGRYELLPVCDRTCYNIIVVEI
jgi:hypothetical protein